jgi:adenylate cyclase
MVQVIVVSPQTADQYRLDLQYERTEVAGAVFDRMSTRLAAVASQTGMSQIFTLRGVDVYRVIDCRPVNAEIQVEAAPLHQYLAHVELLTEQLAACLDLDSPSRPRSRVWTRCSGTRTRSS